jgi:hypothetical protein
MIVAVCNSGRVSVASSEYSNIIQAGQIIVVRWPIPKPKSMTAIHDEQLVNIWPYTIAKPPSEYIVRYIVSPLMIKWIRNSRKAKRHITVQSRWYIS